MADAGVKHGLPRDLAYTLAAPTMIGAGNMVLRTGLHPAILKDDVCSPGNFKMTSFFQTGLKNVGPRVTNLRSLNLVLYSQKKKTPNRRVKTFK